MATEEGRALVKVRFDLAPNAWHGSATERLWAEPVEPDLYRLRNVPFYAFGVSVEDVVRAVNDADEVVFAELAASGGHSTYRLLVTDRSRFDEFWAPLQRLGCTYEAGHPPLLAVDVPPDADVHVAYAAFERGEDAAVWSFEEGHVGHDLFTPGVRLGQPSR